MELKSRWFDRIRASSHPEEEPRDASRGCQHPGCTAAAEYRAPQGRDREGAYFWFCLDHVRDYNKSYNYFAGMTDAAVAAYQKDAVIGHRPTWAMGKNGPAPKGSNPKPEAMRGHINDPFNLFQGATQSRRAEPERRPVRNAERKALEVLNLDDQASAETIKARYKELVKRLHPDANGGDRGSEDKLRAVIQAYNYLKRSGLAETKQSPAP